MSHNSGSNNLLNFTLRLGQSIFLGIAGWYTVNFVVNKMLESGPSSGSIKQQVQKLASILHRPELATVEMTAKEAELAVSSVVDPKDLLETFDDIGGLGDELQEIRDNVVLPIMLFKNKINLGSSMSHPTGVLLYGNPGTGKSLTAKALAKEIGATFLQINTSLLFDKYVGESEKNIVSLFAVAKKLAPTVIFIDEIDGLLRSRSSGGAGSSDHFRISQSLLLSEWDALKGLKGAPVVVLGATNRISDIDPAFIRRMPVQIHIPLPSLQARCDIFTKQLKGHDLAEDVSIEELAQSTDGCSGSDIKELIRLAVLDRMRGALVTVKGTLLGTKSSPLNNNSNTSSSSSSSNNNRSSSNNNRSSSNSSNSSSSKGSVHVRYTDSNLLSLQSTSVGGIDSSSGDSGGDGAIKLTRANFSYALSKSEISAKNVDAFNSQDTSSILNFLEKLKNSANSLNANSKSTSE